MCYVICIRNLLQLLCEVEVIDKILFGKKLRELREKRGFTQEELGEKLNIEWQHVSRLENGKNLPSCAILIGIANVFDIDVRTLVDYDYLDENTDLDKMIKELLDQSTNEQKKTFYKILKAILQ